MTRIRLVFPVILFLLWAGGAATTPPIRSLAKFSEVESVDASRDSSVRIDLGNSESEEIHSVIPVGRLGRSIILEGSREGGCSFPEAVETARRMDLRPTEAFLYLYSGFLALDRGFSNKALGNFEAAHKLYVATQNTHGIALSSMGSARALRALGHLREAWDDILMSMDGAEHIRTQPLREDLRMSYFSRRQEYWALALDILMDLHESEPYSSWDAMALEVHERRLARTLLDRLHSSDRHYEPEIQLVEEDLALRIDHLARYHAQGDREFKKSQIEALLEELAWLRGSKAVGREHISGPIAFSEMRSLLDDETLFLVYGFSEERVILWVLDSELTVYVLDFVPEKFENRLLEFLDTIQQHAHSDYVNSHLSQDLLAPAAKHLLDRRLVIVGEGLFQRLPWAALLDPDSGEPLVVRHEIITLPSMSILAKRRAPAPERPAAEKKMAIFADPVYSTRDSRFESIQTGQDSEDTPREGFPESQWFQRLLSEDLSITLARLPYSGREAEVIIDLIGDDMLFDARGFDANAEVIRDGQLAKYQILHFATHGLVHSELPQLSGLVLSLFDSGGKPRNGFLRMHEISQLKITADLVVLSACSTGVGPAVAGEGVLGLHHAFFSAGASRVLVSLWPIGDEEASEVMARFYHAFLVDGKQPAAALRAAQRSMMNDPKWSDMHYWAGYTLLGDWLELN